MVSDNVSTDYTYPTSTDTDNVLTDNKNSKSAEKLAIVPVAHEKKGKKKADRVNEAGRWVLCRLVQGWSLFIFTVVVVELLVSNNFHDQLRDVFFPAPAP